MHVRRGIPCIIDTAAGTATVLAYITHVTQKIHGGHKQMLAQEREDLRRDTEAVLRLAVSIVSRHDVPAQAERPLRVVGYSHRREPA